MKTLLISWAISVPLAVAATQLSEQWARYCLYGLICVVAALVVKQVDDAIRG